MFDKLTKYQYGVLSCKCGFYKWVPGPIPGHLIHTRGHDCLKCGLPDMRIGEILLTMIPRYQIVRLIAACKTITTICNMEPGEYRDVAYHCLANGIYTDPMKQIAIKLFVGQVLRKMEKNPPPLEAGDGAPASRGNESCLK